MELITEKIVQNKTRRNMMAQEFSDYYEANLKLLKKHHPTIWEIITEKDLTPEGEVFVSPNDKVNLKVENSNGELVNLHDFDNPEAEVPLFLDMVQESSTGVVVLIGMGLGYTPLSLLSKRENIRHLVVFEANPCIFVQALRYMDLSSMLQDPRLLLGVGANPNAEAVFASASRALKLEQIHMLQHIPSLTLNKESYQKLYDLAYNCVNTMNVGGATIFRFGHEFVINRFMHLSSIHHNCLLESLKGKFSKVPAIMVAGGPSLDKNIHLLKEFKDKAIIFAIDTVLPTLLDHGVTPDFVSSIDPQEMTYEKFADIVPKIDGVPFLICSAWLHPKIPKLFPADQVFWSFTGNPIEKWFNGLMGGSISTGGAGTVAHMNLIAALIMGCSPIVFVGQDLAFSDDRDHAGGAVLKDQENVNKLIKSPESLYVDATNGGKVITSRGLLSVKGTFEKMIRNDKNHYINATEGGADIKGTEVMPLQDVLDLYCIDNHNVASSVKEYSLGAEHIALDDLLSEFRLVLKSVKKLRKNIKKSNLVCQRIQGKIEKLDKSKVKYKSFGVLPSQLKKQLSENDVLHKKIDNENKIWKILEDITLDGLRQSERILHEANLVKDIPERYLEWLMLNMKRLDLINDVRTTVLDTFEGSLKKTLEYHKDEKQFIDDTEKATENNQETYDLVRFYFENENYVLADRLLKQLSQLKQDDVNTDCKERAEVDYFKGAIAAYQTDYEKSELYFKRALSFNSDLSEQIDEFRIKMGDTYFKYAHHPEFDRNVLILMLLKGLRYCVDHIEIRKELNTLFLEDLNKVQECLDVNDFNKVDGNILFWHKHLKENIFLSTIFSVERVINFYRLHGKLMFLRGDLTDAAKSFGKLLEYTPNDPEIYIQMTEILFTQEKFDDGIGYLNKAVVLNNDYAIYWENIGDNLSGKGQSIDAIAAYEQCFKFLPGKIELVKKIGDCYRAEEQYEAAAEAYRQFKKLMEGD